MSDPVPLSRLLHAGEGRFDDCIRRWLREFCTIVVDDEPVTPLPRHIRPHPLQEDGQTETRCGKELEVHRRPSEQAPRPVECFTSAVQVGRCRFL